MLMRGMLLSFSDPVAGMVPSLVPFQYNPAEVTRVLRVQSGTSGGSGLRVGGPPVESYTLKIELDALDAIDKPITGSLGIGPLLATIEGLLEPGGGGLAALVGAISGALGGGGGAAPVPAPSLPLVVLAWSLERIVPVRVDSCTIHETGFDALLQPVQATVDLSLTVLRSRDLSPDLKLANVLATAYQAVRTASATVGIAQGVELML
ncbi:hypothetical protein [Micromonospora thermarum]|uniref:Uncharacterized protein n=1 Tax=Micromonospora thermarum TaxID=2720024 RepID=A0ABX0Z6Z5_9ACTN|nr:hypothetical protein [Micromonospora thermarum]NJP31896.1 hypothetical protein [Micromonospora thermarum]